MKRFFILFISVVLLFAFPVMTPGAIREITVTEALGDSNTAVETPVQYLVDGHSETVWQTEASTPLQTWVELKLAEKALIDGLQLFGSYTGEMTVEYRDNVGGSWRRFLAGRQIRYETASGGQFVDLGYDGIATDCLRLSFTNPDADHILGGLAEVRVLGRPAGERLERLDPVSITSGDRFSWSGPGRSFRLNNPAEMLFDHNTYSGWQMHRGGPLETAEAVADLGDSCQVELLKIYADSVTTDSRPPQRDCRLRLQYQNSAQIWVDFPGLSQIDLGRMEGGWASFPVSGEIVTSKIRILLTGRNREAVLREVEIWGRRNDVYGSTYLGMTSGPMLLNASQPANYSFTLTQPASRMNLHLVARPQDTRVDTGLVWELNGRTMGNLNPMLSRNGFLYYRQTISSEDIRSGVNFLRFAGSGLLLKEVCLEFPLENLQESTTGNALMDRLVLIPVATGEQIVELGNLYHLDTIYLSYLSNGSGVRFYAERSGAWEEIPLSGQQPGDVGGDLIFSNIGYASRLKIFVPVGANLTEACVVGSKINDGPPLVRILSPHDGEVLTLTEWGKGDLTGTVENPLAEVRVNGKKVQVEGTTFVVPLAKLGLKPDESETLEVTAVDSAGRNSSDRIMVSIGTPPVFTLDLPDEVTFTAAAEITVSGQVVTPNAKVTVNEREFPVQNRRFSAVVALEEGLNRILVRVAFGPDGKRVGLQERWVVRNSGLPYLKVLTPLAGQLLREGQVIVTGEAGGLSPVRVTVNGQMSTVNGGRFHSAPVLLQEGENKITVIAAYPDGGATTAELTVVRDSTPPVLSGVIPSERAFLNTSGPVVSGAVSDTAPVSVLVNGRAATVVDGRFTIILSLADGWQNIKLEARDAAGNLTVVNREVHIDTIPPQEFQPTANPGSWTSDNRPVITFATGDSGSGIDHYALQLGDGIWKRVISPYQFDTPVPDGEHPVRVKAVDRAGNERTGTVTIFIDTTPPQIPPEFRAVPGNERMVLKWNASDPDVVQYRIERAPGWSPSFHLTQGLEMEDDTVENGVTYRYRIWAIDRAANESAVSEWAEAVVGVAEAEYIPDAGGFVEYDGVSLVLPMEGMPEEVAKVEVTEVQSEFLESKVLYPTIGPIYEFSAVKEDGGYCEHLTIDEGFLGTIAYDPAQIPEGFPEQNLGVYYYDTMFDRWFQIDSATVDVENNKIYFITNHFTSFSVQATVVQDLSPQEYKDAGYSPLRTYAEHAGVSVSPQGGTASTSAVELVLPGKNGFDFVLKRRYDTATARSDAFALSINGSMAFNFCNPANNGGDILSMVQATEQLTAWQQAGVQLTDNVRNIIEQYLFNQGDYAYSMGQGWRLNIPYMKAANSAMMLCTADGAMYSVGEMEIIDGVYGAVAVGPTLVQGRNITFRQREGDDFTLTAVQVNANFNLTGIFTQRKDEIFKSRWYSLSYTLKMKDGTVYEMDGLGRTTRITDPSGLNVIRLYYNGLYLDYIEDSVGRKICFDYQFNLAFIWTRINRIWVEEDPFGREINYTVSHTGLLESARDAGGRESRYEYDFKVLYGGEIGIKVNVMTILLKVVCGPLAQMLGPILGANDLEVFGRVGAQAVFVMKQMEAPGQGKVTVDYIKKDVIYGSTNIEYWWEVPISITLSLNLDQRLLAERVKVYLDSEEPLRTTTYSYDFEYYTEGQPFISRTVEDDGKKKTIYSYTPVRRTRIRWQDGQLKTGDPLGNLISFPVLFWRVDILPVNHATEYRDAQTDRTLERTTTQYDDQMRPKEQTVWHGVNFRRVVYHYDNWGNVTYTEETSQSGDRVNKVGTWMVYHDTDSVMNETMLQVPSSYTPPVLTRNRHNLPLYRLTVNYALAGVDGLTNQVMRNCYQYNARGQMTAEAAWNGNEWLETTYAYHPAHGSLTRKVNPEGHETVYDYDLYGFPTVITEKNVINAQGETSDIVTRMGYNWRTGWKSWEKNPRGYVTQYTYDALGRMIETIKPDDNDDTSWVPSGGYLPPFRKNNPQLDVTYNDTELWAKATDPLRHQTLYDFDNLGRLVKLVKYRWDKDTQQYVEAAVTTLTYDPWGNITAITDPNGNAEGPAWQHTTCYEYDALGRNVAIIYPDETDPLEDNPRKRMEFDYGTNTLTTWDENNHRTVEYQDMQGRTVRQLLYDGEREIEMLRYFDGLGNEVAAVDPKGSKTVSKYNCLNQVERVILPAETFRENQVEVTVSPYQRYEYNRAGQKVKEIRSMPGGTEHVTEYDFDGVGRAIRSTVSYTDQGIQKEAVTEVYYDGNGNKVRVVDANNTSKPYEDQVGADFTYSAQDLVLTETDPLGNRTAYTYDRGENRLNMTDPRGTCGKYEGDFTIEYEYDDLNRLVKGYLPQAPGMTEKPVVRLDYDPRGNLLERTEPDGGKTSYTYDPRNRPVTVTVEGDGGISYTTKHTYDAVGNEVSVEDAAGNLTVKAYDDLNRLVRVTYPEGNTDAFEYDENNNRTAYVNGKQVRTEYNYDRYNRLKETRDAKNGLTSYRYDRWGNMTWIQNAAGHETKYEYDELNRLLKETDPQLHEQSFRYDPVGNRVAGKDPNGTESSYEYYDNNLLKKVALTNDERSMALEYLYDEAGMRKSATSGEVVTEYNTYTTGYQPDPYGRVHKETKTFGGKSFAVEYQYDVMGRLAGVKTPAGTWVEYEYNNLNQLVKVPGYIEEKPEYNSAGWLKGVKAANGVSTGYDYDRNGRLTQLGYNNMDGLLKEYRLEYDAANNILKKNQDTFQYDALNQLVYANLQGKFEVNPEEEVQKVGMTRDDYDGQNSLEMVADGTRVIALDHAAGSIGVDLQVEVPVTRVELTPMHPDHKVAARNTKIYSSRDNQEFTEITGWRFMNREDGKVEIELETPVLARFLKVKTLFDYRDLEFKPVSKATFTNQAEKLIQVYYILNRRQEEYNYDAIGNRTTDRVVQRNAVAKSYSYYSQSSRLESNGKYRYEYDDNGNLVRKTALVGEAEVWVYGYDLLNRLVKVEKNGQTVAEYIYDEGGLRVRKMKAGATVDYVFDIGGNVVYEEENGRFTEYVYVLGKHFARNDGTVGSGERTRYYYHTDHLGSTVLVTDGAGTTVWSTEYTPFGEVALEEGKLEKAGKFTGKDLDEDTGLYYFNARWYDQEIGRFICEDSINDPNNFNFYTYCANNPLINIDPTGHSIDWSLYSETYNPSEDLSYLNQNASQWDRFVNAYTSMGNDSFKSYLKNKGINYQFNENNTTNYTFTNSDGQTALSASDFNGFNVSADEQKFKYYEAMVENIGTFLDNNPGLSLDQVKGLFDAALISADNSWGYGKNEFRFEGRGSNYDKQFNAEAIVMNQGMILGVFTRSSTLPDPDFQGVNSGIYNYKVGHHHRNRYTRESKGKSLLYTEVGETPQKNDGKWFTFSKGNVIKAIDKWTKGTYKALNIDVPGRSGINSHAGTAYNNKTLIGSEGCMILHSEDYLRYINLFDSEETGKYIISN